MGSMAYGAIINRVVLPSVAKVTYRVAIRAHRATSVTEFASGELHIIREV